MIIQIESGRPSTRQTESCGKIISSSTTIQNSDQSEIITKWEVLERLIKGSQNPFDVPVTVKESEEKLVVLEPENACGVDIILNEMLKHTDRNFKMASVLKAFNLVLCVGFSPRSGLRASSAPSIRVVTNWTPTITEASLTSFHGQQ